MKKVYRFFTSQLPENTPNEWKEEFRRELELENFQRLKVLIPVLFTAELVIFLYPNPIDSLDEVLVPFLIFHILYAPLFIFYYRRRDEAPVSRLRIVRSLYAAAFIVFGAALSLVVHHQTDLVHMYIMTVLGAAVFINIPPGELALLLGLTFGGYAAALPHFQSSEQVTLVILSNTFIFNVCAWIAGRMIHTIKAASFADSRELKENNALLTHLTQRDAMTELFNHNTVYQRLHEEIGRAERVGYPLTLMMVDIDNFKAVNDIFGHIIGDQVIIAMARTLKKTARVTDILGRCGGDEFLIIMPDTNIGGADRFARRLQTALARLTLPHDISVTLSGGIAGYSGESLTQFIKRADNNLYEAKRSGKNRFVSAQRERPQT